MKSFTLMMDIMGWLGIIGAAGYIGIIGICLYQKKVRERSTQEK